MRDEPMPATNTRIDDRTAALIDEAVARLASCPARDVAKSLAVAGVGFRTTVRVLADPNARRRLDRE